MTEDTEIREVLRGAVDCYVHANPELLPRRLDDVELAREMKEEGFRAAVHRHQFSPTGDRAQLASAATGFDMRGAVACNGTVGGLNPIVVEHAIRMGAVYVSMPTLSGSAYYPRASDYARAAVTLAGPVPVVDESGAVLPAVHDVLDVVAANDVVLNLGYLVPEDYLKVLAVARDHRVQKIVATNPVSVVKLSEDQIGEVMAVPQAHLEFASSSLRPRDGGPAPAAPVIAGSIKRYGAERCLLTSDTGAGNEDTALELYTIGCTTLVEHGIGLDELRTMVYDTPARLIGIAD
jgi:hypothetical protein